MLTEVHDPLRRAIKWESRSVHLSWHSLRSSLCTTESRAKEQFYVRGNTTVVVQEQAA